MRLLITGGFRGWSIQRRHFRLQACKVRTLPWKPNFGQNRQKNHKNGHKFTCMQHIHAEFGFGIGFLCYQRIYLRLFGTQGTKGCYHGNQFWGLKLLEMHINAFLREIARMWLRITGDFHGWPIQRGHFWLQGSKRYCHGNQFLAKIGKISQKWP